MKKSVKQSKKLCKHRWQIICIVPTKYLGSGEYTKPILNKICQKCLEKRYI